MKVLLILLFSFTMIWKSVAEYKDSDQVIIKEIVRKIEVTNIGLNNVSKSSLDLSRQCSPKQFSECMLVNWRQDFFSFLKRQK